MKDDVKALIAQAEKHEYTDVRDFVRAMAAYSTLENLGQSPDYRITGPVKPENLFNNAYNQFASDCAAEEVMVEAEYNDWIKDATSIAVTLKKTGFPLTVENGNHAWNGTGPFAKKA